MDVLFAEAKEYLKYTWNIEANDQQLEKAINRYDNYLATLVPSNTPFAKYIHKERILYDLFMDDEIIVFCYDPTADDDAESFYSNNTYDDHSSQSAKFMNGVRTMDETDFREQLSANEFVGGYWEPHMHWVLSKKMLLKTIQ
jgi:hypothetical protein